MLHVSLLKAQFQSCSFCMWRNFKQPMLALDRIYQEAATTSTLCSTISLRLDVTMAPLQQVFRTCVPTYNDPITIYSHPKSNQNWRKWKRHFRVTWPFQKCCRLHNLKSNKILDRWRSWFIFWFFMLNYEIFEIQFLVLKSWWWCLLLEISKEVPKSCHPNKFITLRFCFQTRDVKKKKVF